MKIPTGAVGEWWNCPSECRNPFLICLFWFLCVSFITNSFLQNKKRRRVFHLQCLSVYILEMLASSTLPPSIVETNFSMKSLTQSFSFCFNGSAFSPIFSPSFDIILLTFELSLLKRRLNVSKIPWSQDGLFKQL
jgi:hypothetical protein